MFAKNRFILSIVTGVVLWATVVGLNPIPFQDVLATEDITAGSSAFVFRESRKKPQSRAAGGQATRSAAGRKAVSVRTSAQIAAASKKRLQNAIAARKKAAATAANRKIALSNTLTAKAEDFLDKGQTDLAVTNYRAAIAQHAKNTRATEGLSNALTSKGIEVAGDTNNEAAIVLFDEAIKFDKQNDVAYAKLGAIYDAKGQNAKAIEHYQKALGMNAEFTDLHTPLGLAYLEAGEIAAAEGSLQKATAAGVDTADTRYLKGLVALKQNKNAEAATAFEQTLALNNGYAMANYYRGQALDRQGQDEQAIAAYTATLNAEPTFGPAAFDLGVVYYNKGDYTNAATAYETAVKIEPANAQAHANLASTYRQLERYPDANAEYKTASTSIKNPDLYSEWGYCLGKTKEWDTSVERLRTALELSPTGIDNSNLGWAYLNAANEDTAQKNEPEAKKNLDLAKTVLQKAVEQEPKLDAAYLNLGSTHNGLGDYQAAVQVLNTALTIRRDWGVAINQLGLGYRGLRDFKNAIATFKRVTDKDTNNIYGLFNLGETYFASGNKNEAKKINDRLKKIDPALANRLDGIISGRIVVDKFKQKIDSKIPSIPRLPRFP